MSERKRRKFLVLLVEENLEMEEIQSLHFQTAEWAGLDVEHGLMFPKKYDNKYLQDHFFSKFTALIGRMNDGFPFASIVKNAFGIYWPKLST